MFSIISLTENITEFKKYEEKIVEMCKKVGSNSIKQQLEELDYKIFKKIDKNIFRNKGIRKIDIKTLLAEVDINRHVYLIDEKRLEKIANKDENILYILAKKRLDSGKKTIYFLDEFVDLKGYGKFSIGVVELMLKYITDNSYRKTANIINDITGLKITGSAVWNVIQTVGNNLKEKEIHEQEQYNKGTLKYINKDNHVIFSELDGVYINLQGKDRKEKIEAYKKNHIECTEVPKSVRKKEIKVVSIYEGFQKVAKARNQLVNKKVYAQTIDNINIKDKTNIYIEKTYDKNKLKMIIKNSDGGTWTKEKSNNKVFYQLDMFHIKQMISRCIREKEDINSMNKLLENKKYNDMILFSESLKYKYDGEVNEVENLNKLQEYIKKNNKNFNRYQDSELFKKEKRKGTWYKNLGTQESTNYQVITKRMKKRRMCFSKAGADNLSRILAMVMSYDYKGLENELKLQTIPLEILEESKEHIEYEKLLLQKYRINKRENKNKKYNDSFRGSIPGLNCYNTNEMMKIKSLIY